MEKQVYIVIGRSGEILDRATWVVGAFTTEEKAKDWAQKAEHRTKHLTENYGPLWFTLVDGKLQEELQELRNLHQLGEVSDQEYFKIYLARRGELTAAFNPWDPDMQMDTEHFTPCTYSILSLFLDPNSETQEQEVSEAQNENSVEAQGDRRVSEGEPPSQE